LFPVRLSKHAVMLASTWENQLIDLVVCAVLDVVPTQPGRIGGLKHRGHGLPRHPLRCRYCSGRQSVCAKLQHQLGSDLPYHEWSPSVACRIHATAGAEARWPPSTPLAAPKGTLRYSAPWLPHTRLMDPTTATMQGPDVVSRQI